MNVVNKIEKLLDLFGIDYYISDAKKQPQAKKGTTTIRSIGTGLEARDIENGDLFLSVNHEKKEICISLTGEGLEGGDYGEETNSLEFYSRKKYLSISSTDAKIMLDIIDIIIENKSPSP